MTDTPRTDKALSHQGAAHRDCITRLERLIPISRRLEHENTRMRQVLTLIAKPALGGKQQQWAAQAVLAELERP